MTIKKMFKYQNGSKQKCVFQVFEGKTQCDCGSPAVGKINRNDYLCDEHFEYVRSIEGIPRKTIQFELEK